MRELEEGRNIALVTDAGTPCISDPGYRIVRAALERGIRVVPVPGPCSFIAALSASGRPTDSFVFLGFLPPRKTARQTLLESLKKEVRTLVFFESPLRMLETLDDMAAILGDRQTTIARELTKIYEEIFTGTISSARKHFSRKPVKGEVILMVEKADASLHEVPEDKELLQQIEELASHRAMTRNEALKQIARQYGLPKRELYQRLMASMLASRPPGEEK